MTRRNPQSSETPSHNDYFGGTTQQKGQATSRLAFLCWPHGWPAWSFGFAQEATTRGGSCTVASIGATSCLPESIGRLSAVIDSPPIPQRERHPLSCMVIVPTIGHVPWCPTASDAPSRRMSSLRSE